MFCDHNIDVYVIMSCTRTRKFLFLTRSYRMYFKMEKIYKSVTSSGHRFIADAFLSHNYLSFYIHRIVMYFLHVI